MYRAGGRFRANEVQYGISSLSPLRKRQGHNGLSFFAIAFNIKKMCSKIAKQVKIGGNTPHFDLFMPKSQILASENRFFEKNPQKSIA